LGSASLAAIVDGAKLASLLVQIDQLYDQALATAQNRNRETKRHFHRFSAG
jgi:hypothetical protein